jgi:gluconolactonase
MISLDGHGIGDDSVLQQNPELSRVLLLTTSVLKACEQPVEEPHECGDYKLCGFRIQKDSAMRCLAAVVALGLFCGGRCPGGELVDSSAALETVRTDFGLADGPAWDGAGTLYVPDVKGGTLSAYRPESDEWQVILPEAGRISATYYSHGRLYLSDNGESGISILNDGGKQALVSNDPQTRPPQRPNDLVVDAQGGVYYTLTATNEVMYVTADGQQQAAVTGIESPNGITLSPDGKRLYVSAYAPKQIWIYEVTSPRTLSEGKLFATMDDGEAKGADGMTIDSAGNVYCAGAADVWIWSPEGKLLEKIRTPERPINCTFGGGDLKTLYITGFGGLWRQRMHVAGLPPISGRPSTAE